LQRELYLPLANCKFGAFLSTVKAECSQREVRVIFPMTEVSMATVLEHREEFENV
jgi:hypothetical protein